MMTANAYQQYKNQSINTMTGGELLIMLYDELIKRVKQAEMAIDSQKAENANDSLQRAQDIIQYLMATLDDQYEIAKSLRALYDFFYAQLVKANINKDAEILRELLPMLIELRSTWKEADKLSHQR